MDAQTKLNVVFMGTPDFAAIILRALHHWSGCTVSAVYCQPDRPAGRGNKLHTPAVKVLAQELGLPVYQPENFKDAATVDTLRTLAPDVLVVAAYGLILPQAVLGIPRIAPINVHGSLLPLYRGAAPIQRAIQDGRRETGVSIMRMEAGMDTGAVYHQAVLPIGEHTAGSLHDALADLGARTLITVLGNFAAYPPQPQDGSKATYAPKMHKSDGFINWDMSAAQVHAHIRAVTPWPGARARVFSAIRGVTRVSLGVGCEGALKPTGIPAGQIWMLSGGELAVSCADHFYSLGTVRPENRKDMSARDFAHGYLDYPQGYCGRCLGPSEETGEPAEPSDASVNVEAQDASACELCVD